VEPAARSACGRAMDSRQRSCTRRRRRAGTLALQRGRRCVKGAAVYGVRQLQRARRGGGVRGEEANREGGGKEVAGVPRRAALPARHGCARIFCLYRMARCISLRRVATRC
jgi:hypothetical protein